MLKIVPNGPNRLDIEMNGKLNSEEMKIALDELLSMSNDIQNGRILCEIVDFQLPSLGAIAVNFPGFLRCLVC